MLLAALLLLAPPQDAPPKGPPDDSTVMAPQTGGDGTTRWSILADPCAATDTDPSEIVVCGSAVAESPRLPLPAERGPPDHPVPVNSEMTGSGALAATAAPCATISSGCTTGLDLFGGGTFLIRAIGKAIDPNSCCERPGEATSAGMLVGDLVAAAKRIGRKKPDASKRLTVPLGDPATDRMPAIAPAGTANQ